MSRKSLYQKYIQKKHIRQKQRNPQETRIQLSDHFTYGRLFRFVLSPVLMMLFTSLYSIVDGFFVSNFVGKTPFAAVNLIMPVAMALGSVGFMVGTGGSALVSMMLGQGKKDLANQYFSLLVYVSAGFSFLLSVAGFLLTPQISAALGATGELLNQCIIYGRILFLATMPFVLQNVFNSFFIAAEKPDLSLKVSVMAGCANIILDFLFIAVFRWGVAGAAAATAIGQMAGGIVPLVYFLKKNDSLLQLTKTKFNGNVLLKTCANGSSEMVSNLSASVVNILYNFQLMRISGENGVAAYGIVMYVNFIFMAIYLGYSIGSSPIVSYHYGAGNKDELKNLFRKGWILTGGGGILLTLLAELLNRPLVQLFAGYDAELFAITSHGFRLYALSFLLMGINIWGSAFFTALNNGAVSAAISFLRSLVFQIAAVFILPLLLGIDGIWLAIVLAELMAALITAWFFLTKRKQYGYF